MWKILTAASTALALIGTPALADLDTWDADDDQFVDQDEFATGFDEGETFGEWDADDDDLLTEDEWTAGFGDDYDEAEFGTFDDWDTDDDQALGEDEFTEGVFGAYDEDDDDLWGEEEYTAYEEDDWF